MFHETTQCFTSETEVAAAAGLVDLSTVYLHGEYDEIALEVGNTGAGALSNFTMLVQATASSGWATLLTGAAWATAAGLLRAFSAAINTLAAPVAPATENAETVLLDVGPVHAVKFQADSAGDTTIVLRGQASKK